MGNRSAWVQAAHTFEERVERPPRAAHVRGRSPAAIAPARGRLGGHGGNQLRVPMELHVQTPLAGQAAEDPRLDVSAHTHCVCAADKSEPNCLRPGEHRRYTQSAGVGRRGWKATTFSFFVALGAFTKAFGKKIGLVNFGSVYQAHVRLASLVNEKIDLKPLVWQESIVWKTVILEI